MNSSDYLSEKTIVRFWKHVDKNGPVPAHCPELGCCWIWTGSRSVVRGQKSYGTLTVHFPVGWRPVGAHRISFILAKGPIGEGRLIMHRCDNKQCVRPTHLEQGTTSENGRDAYDHHLREPVDLSGEKHPMAKLTEGDVQEIRRLGRTVPWKETAARFSITPDNVGSIVRGQTWVDLPWPEGLKPTLYLESVQNRTHCAEGHELTPENSYRPKGTGAPRCIICRKVRMDEWRKGQPMPTRAPLMRAPRETPNRKIA